MPTGQEENSDWEITSDGLYIAKRSFLVRRGYCCANRCRNCPYINWQAQPTWEPIPAGQVKHGHAPQKSITAAKTLLHYHQQQLRQCPLAEQEQHQRMINHYTTLVERWKANS